MVEKKVTSAGEVAGTLDFGIVHKMAVGLADDGNSPGVRVEFPPELKLPAVQFVLEPSQALSLIDMFQKLDQTLGWRRPVASPHQGLKPKQ